MARQTFVQDPITHQLIPKDEWLGPSASNTTYIIPDIQPYKSMVTGEVITSRSRHREHLRQHGLIEIGNEVNAHMKNVEAKKPLPNVKNDLIRVMRQKGFL